MTAVEDRLGALERGSGGGGGGGGGGSGNEELENRLGIAEYWIEINERDIEKLTNRQDSLEISTNNQIRTLENKVRAVEDTVNNFQSLGEDLTNYVDRIDS